VHSAAAETHVRLLAEAELRRAALAPRFQWLDEDFKEGGEPPQEAGLLRVRAVLNALCRVGAVSEAVARSVAGDFIAALAARGLHDPGALLAVPYPGDPPPAAGPAGAAPPAGPPDGRYRCIPIGAVLPASRAGHQGAVHLQTLVLAPDRAAIVTSFVSTWREVTHYPDDPAAQLAFPPFGRAGLTDDHGRPYQLSFSTGEGGWLEAGLLDISPPPPDGVHWLELPTVPGSVLRIELADRAPVPPARHEPVPPAAVGERLLTAVAETMLGGGALAGIEATRLAGSLAEVAVALQAVRALPASSPVPAQLAALCQRRAIEVRGRLADQAQSVRLPDAWRSVLTQRRSGPPEGRTGLAPVAAVLPEIDGARFVLAGLASWEHQASLTVLCWGWPPERGEFRPSRPFSWWARDDAGRWHVGRISTFNAVPGTFHVEFTPPLPPGTTALDIMLTGSSARVTVPVPLRWPDEPG
jgi:hypothetical protein